MSTVVFIQTTEPNDDIFSIKHHRRSAPQSKKFKDHSTSFEVTKHCHSDRSGETLQALNT